MTYHISTNQAICTKCTITLPTINININQKCNSYLETAGIIQGMQWLAVSLCSWMSKCRSSWWWWSVKGFKSQTQNIKRIDKQKLMMFLMIWVNPNTSMLHCTVTHLTVGLTESGEQRKNADECSVSAVHNTRDKWKRLKWHSLLFKHKKTPNIYKDRERETERENVV